jgi:myo-inositol-1(or 4)-monophosphatase
MQSKLEFAIQTSHKAGELLLGYFQTTGTQADLKADHSVVTEADIAADKMIAKEIQGSFPADRILSEELQTSIPDYTGKYVWIVDPLDGTTNFSLGLPIWGVLIVLTIDGRPELASLYFPAIDELYTAQRGQGSYLNGKQITVQPPDPKQPWSFFSCCSRTFRNYSVNIPYKTRILGSAAYSLSCVARGIALLGFEATPKIWDIAGAWLLVQEAGGVIETYDNSLPFPLVPGKDYSRQDYPTLAAATPRLISKAHQQIQPK